MGYVEQPVTTKISLLTLFPQQLHLFVLNPRDRARFTHWEKEKEKEEILWNVTEDRDKKSPSVNSCAPTEGF